MPQKFNFTIGLIGNPNVGKSTLFNSLTGSRQHVGNWPGKTIEKKEGSLVWHDYLINLVDLPGTYSLKAFTAEEAVVTDFVTTEKPDAIIQIIDAQNLTRNLFLTLQLLELKVKLILVLNMSDLAMADGVFVNPENLSRELGVPVLTVNARDKSQMPDFLKKFTERLVIDQPLEKNDTLKNILNSHITDPEYNKKRYQFIQDLEKQIIKREVPISNRNFGKHFDAVVMHKYFGIPFFLMVIWLVFQVTFKVSAPISVWIQSFFSFLSVQITGLFASLGISTWFTSLFTQGIIGGVGGVLVFVPSISILFLLISVMEDTGYMARVAYTMDKLMHKLGLHGKAFIPLVLGFGCNVPGVMATRTLETKSERLLTILISPFISCSARLPVYVLFAGIFFTNYQGLIVASLYILSITVAILVGLVLKRFFSQGLSAELLIELPPYRIPTIKTLLLHVWEKVGAFIKKAGTIILAFSVIIWLLASLPVGAIYASRESLAGSLGFAIAPVFAPLGFDSWQAGVALTFGLVAKEVVVSTFGALHGATGNTVTDAVLLSDSLKQYFTPLSAYAFLVFVLLYSPCVATIAVIKKETASIKWALFVVLLTISIAYIVALVIYQGGKLIGLN